MVERINLPPSVKYPQLNPFKQGTKEHSFTRDLINANNQQRIILEQLFRRLGGGTDLIEVIQSGSLYPNDIYSQEIGAFDQPYSVDIGSEDDGETYPQVIQEDIKWLVTPSNSSFYDMTIWEWLITDANNPLITFPPYPGDGDRIKITRQNKARFVTENPFNYRGKDYKSGNLPGGKGSVYTLEFKDKWYLV